MLSRSNLAAHQQFSSSVVLWDGQCSEPFIIGQGVRQGGILSPFLYCMYVDELLDQLTTSGLGVAIPYCGSPMYEDDLALIIDSPATLQSMLNIVHRYALCWRYHLNGVKSVVMVFGESTCSRRKARADRRWRLGDSVLKEVDEQHHLGILRSVFNSSVARTNERATSGRSTFSNSSLLLKHRKQKIIFLYHPRLTEEHFAEAH